METTKSKIDELFSNGVITREMKIEFMNKHCRRERKKLGVAEKVNEIYRKWKIGDILR